MPDYSAIDNSQLINFIFYPRDDFTTCQGNCFDISVPVAQDVEVACRMYYRDQAWPTILYFHGNGEVASDYDGISTLYLKEGINLLVADYRGYGGSTGLPTLNNLAPDANAIFATVREELTRRDFSGRLWIMGRSLGSLSAIELALRHGDAFGGLIIESGFASILSITLHLDLPMPEGIDPGVILEECLAMVRQITIPALIIHGEWDNLVPVREAHQLHEQIGSNQKELLVIPQADHNDIMFTGIERYFDAIRRFVIH